MAIQSNAKVKLWHFKTHWNVFM